MNCISTIGIVALSLPTVGKRAERIHNAISYLEKQGFHLKIGNSVFERQAYRSSDITTRTEDVMRFFRDPDVDCILSTTGGFNSNEILEFLDYPIIQKNPKWFVGYSDCTAPNLALYTKTGMQTVNGPMLVDFQDDPTAFSRLFTTLNTQVMDFTLPSVLCEWGAKHKRQCPILQCLPGKISRADGSLIAGNLSTFVLMLGTPYFPDCADTILFLEYDPCETDGLPSLQRMLWQLRQNGIFKKIKGLVIGTLPFTTQQEEKKAWRLSDVLAEATTGYSFPVIFDAPFGHLYPSWILINGAKVRIEGIKISMQ